MENNELLQAISEMMDKKLKPIQQDISGMKADISGLKEGQGSLQQDVSGMKSDISSLKTGQESIQGQVTKTNITLENDVGKKLSALFDGHQLNTEKLNHISKTVDDIDATTTAVDVVTKANTDEINKLKSKIG